MDSYMKRFLRGLLAHQNNLTEYIDNLYKNRDYGDLNEILGLLKKEGYVACIYADNRAYNISFSRIFQKLIFLCTNGIMNNNRNLYNRRLKDTHYVQIFQNK